MDATKTKFNEAMERTMRSGSGDLRALHASLALVPYDRRNMFEHSFFGVLAACTETEVWSEALKRAQGHFADLELWGNCGGAR